MYHVPFLPKDYILDTAGEQMTEMGFDPNLGVMAPQKNYVWSGGKMLATYDPDGFHFYLNDPLGTRRVQTDFAGNLEQTCSSMPFGDQDSCTDGHLFTGKERDTESGNDYFGARYFGSSMGRFLSPDPLMASAKVWDPQTWNRYVYGRNNPLKMIDPTGMVEETAAQCSQDKSCTTVNLHVIWDVHGNQGGQLTDDQKAALVSGQLQDAKDQYGNAHISFNVTFGDGSSTGGQKDLGLE
jgi:RHS repeat-associated protein